jgi:hypothetical protein
MITKRYTWQLRKIPNRAGGPVHIKRVGWYLFGLIPLVIADVEY